MRFEPTYCSGFAIESGDRPELQGRPVPYRPELPLLRRLVALCQPPVALCDGMADGQRRGGCMLHYETIGTNY
jgi:hypothetical protein